MINYLKIKFIQYKRSKKDFFSMLIRIILYIIPYYLMLSFQRIDNIGYVLISSIVIYVIINIIVGANFEIFKEYNMNKFVNVLMSPYNFTSFAVAQVLFWTIIMIFESTIIIITLWMLNIIPYIENLFNLLLIPFTLLSLIITAITVNFILIYLTITGKSFQYSSLITNILLLLSGSLFPIQVFPTFIQKISQIIPFTYILELFRYILVGESMTFDVKKQIIILILLNILWGLVSYIIYTRKTYPMLKEVE